MLELFKLLGVIAIDNSDVDKKLPETTEKAKTASSTMSTAFKAIGTAVATYLSVSAIKDFGLACITASADAQAASSQFTQVFGDLEEQASDSLSKIANEAGIVETRMKGSFTKIAAFAKTSGMETDDALALSERAMRAVADSAAFYDRSLEETTESLQSFLKGNYENDAALGLSATETTRNAAANALYGKSFKDLSEAQKQLTLLQMVEDANKASGALGQAARESDTWTNVTGNLQQAWTDFKATVGDNFLDGAVQAVKAVTGVVVELTGKIPALIQWVQETKEKVATSFTDIQMFWQDYLKPCLEAIGNFLINVLFPIFDLIFGTQIRAVVKSAFSFIKDLWNNMLMPVFKGITEFLTGIFTLDFGKALNGILNIVIGVFNGILAAVSTPMTLVKNIINEAIEFIKEKFNFDWSLPHIKLPHFRVSGGEAPWGFGGKGSLPSVGIDWYARAMDNPLLMTEPTIFGYNQSTGQLMGGGEAGAEVVSGANTLMNMISGAVASQNDAVVVMLSKILNAILSLDENMGGNLREALDGTSLEINKREFARLVKGVAY